MRPGPRAAVLLLCTLLPVPLAAGVNDGFTAELSGQTQISNPTIGQRIAVPVLLRGTSQVAAARVTVTFDPAVIAFLRFTAGPLLGEPLAEVTGPTALDDEQSAVQAFLRVADGASAPAQTEGVVGTFEFELIADLPDAGTAIALHRVEIAATVDGADADLLEPTPGQLFVRLTPLINNPIFNVVVERGHDAALCTWSTRFPGLDDVVRVRAVDEQAYRQVTSALAERVTDEHRQALVALTRDGIRVNDLGDAELVQHLRDWIGVPTGADEELVLAQAARRIRDLWGILQARGHTVRIDSLAPETDYDYELASRDLLGRRSRVERGRFRTRGGPDLRPLFVHAFEVQPTATGASVSFGTNRPATTRYRLTRIGDTTAVAADTLYEDGETRTRFALEGLQADTDYELDVLTILVQADALVAAGLPSTAASRRVIERFRTRRQAHPVRMQGPPFKIVGADRANIVFDVNQPVDAVVDYGVIAAGQDPDTLPDVLWDWSQETVGSLRRHNLTLSNLPSGTLFRYQIVLVSTDGDTFSTNPRGSFQWSRDLKFRTAAAGDTLPPALIQGPVVDIRDVLAVVRFATDVPTAATVLIGTATSFGTEDEFEFEDRTADGERRFSNRHSILVSGLDAGQTYRYRVRVESTSGKVTEVEPGAGKRLGVHQPPGGAGAFTTHSTPDTRLPVILAGPTVASKTHDTAVIEWTTDEPANSEVRFGVAGVDEETETSAPSETEHRLVLTNLEGGTSYSYRVGSTDAAGNGAALSSQGVFTTDAEIDLTAPRLVVPPTVTYHNDESATIQWHTDEDATAQVSFGTSADDLGFVRTLPSTDRDHEVTLTNLSPGTTYFYRVESEDLSNNGPTVSDVAAFTTDAVADLTPPAILGAVTVATSDSTAILTWNTDELADSFVDFGTVSGLLDLTTGDAADVTAHEVTLTNLVPGTTYFYAVGSTDRAGNGPTRSAQGSFATLASGDVAAPATPAGLAATAGNEEVVLTWSANDELDLAGYNVYRRSAGADGFAAVVSRVVGTSYTDDGVSNGVALDYRITAIDRQTPPNESAPTASVAVTPTPAASPTAPAQLRVTSASPRPTFSFASADPVTDGAPLTYTLQVSTTPDFADVAASVSGLAEGAGRTSWTVDRDLADGGQYHWRVRAVEGALTGPFSMAHGFTVGAAPAGDFDGSGSVDLVDFFLFAEAYGRDAGEAADFDLDASGAGSPIDLVDFFLFAEAFGTGAGKATGAAAIAHRVEDGGALRVTVAGDLLGQNGGDRDRVQVRIAGHELAPLRAYGLVVTWDPTILEWADSGPGPGPLLGSRGPAPRLLQVLSRDPGRAVLAGATGGPAVGGSGLLAQLTFRRRHTGLGAGPIAVQVPQAYVAARADDVRRIVDIDDGRLLPAAFALGSAYPNPFNPATRIDFALATESAVRLTIYDVLGQRVRSLVRAGSMAAGHYGVTWAGRDDAGRPVAAGLYLYRLETPSVTRTRKVMLLK